MGYRARRMRYICKGCFDKCLKCLGRIPCATLVAFVFYILSVTVYLAAVVSGLVIVQRFFNFETDIESVAIPLYVVCLIIGFYFLIMAFLTTGDTRKEVCKTQCCNIGGRICSVFIIAVAWLLNISWVLISGLTLIPLTIFLIMKATCDTDFVQGLTKCVHLKTIGVAPRNDTICGDVASRFCGSVGVVTDDLLVAYVASIVICISLVHFLMSMSVNFVNVKKEAEDYEKMQ